MENYLIFIVLIPIVVILLLIILVAIKISRTQISRNKIFKEVEDKSASSRKMIFLAVFGGSENIISVNREMSRINVKVKDLEKVDLEQIKQLGASGVLVVGSEVKCSFNNLAEEVYNLIK